MLSLLGVLESRRTGLLFAFNGYQPVSTAFFCLTQRTQSSQRLLHTAKFLCVLCALCFLCVKNLFIFSTFATSHRGTGVAFASGSFGVLENWAAFRLQRIPARVNCAFLFNTKNTKFTKMLHTAKFLCVGNVLRGDFQGKPFSGVASLPRMEYDVGRQVTGNHLLLACETLERTLSQAVRPTLDLVFECRRKPPAWGERPRILVCNMQTRLLHPWQHF